VEGENYVVDFNTGEKRDCKLLVENNYLPEDGCIFYPYEIQETSASILSFLNVPDVSFPWFSRFLKHS